MKKPFICFILVFITLTSFSQIRKITPADLRVLQRKEDSLKGYAKDLVTDSLPNNRMRSDSFFTKVLIRSFLVKNSFYYPFDSVKGVSTLYAPDSSFRIMTWSLTYNEDLSQQRGVIQFPTKDGSAKFVPLYDYSTLTPYPEDSVRDHKHWIGAIYYNIVQTRYNNRNYYTLFGYDPNTPFTNKKWIEVLTFDQSGMPVFGGKYFSFAKDTAKREDQFRYSIEYKKQASATVDFDPDLKLILVDHLISESDEPDLPQTFVPDGDYEGFKWTNGKWLHIDKVFDQKLEDGEAPVPDPILDSKGNTNQEKLKQQSEKNNTKKKAK
ncbi:MAG: hypothetical protein J7502_09840 [Flavisolibacter sp.]|nr:hypothetical protein [Flavisolibacter sp.]